MKTHDPGFTLTEALVVVAILVIVAVLAVPRVARDLRQARANGAARELLVTINFARSQAVTMNRAVRLTLHPVGLNAGGNVQDVEVGADTQCQSAADGTLSVEGYDIRSSQNEVGFVKMRYQGADWGGDFELCLKPDGSVIDMNNSPNLTMLSGPLDMEVAVIQEGAVVGTTKWVRLSPNGTARIFAY